LTTRDEAGEIVRVPVDIVAALDGQGDRVLEDGDVLSVPQVRDYVYVSGYVTRPGRYAYRGDWTAADYIGEAGGPTPAGSRDRVLVLDPDGDKRKGDRQARVERGETVYLERSASGQATAALGILANLSALIISVVALSR
jgi:protein involved in polysaccharide export with SLBB domain